MRGEWRSEPTWPAERLRSRVLRPEGKAIDRIDVAGDVGIAAWISCAGKPPWTLPEDQREDDARSLTYDWEPFEEELLMWWNFVGRTHDDIADARKAWQVERELPRDDRTRFGFVDGHDGFSLPAPELPSVELKPRPRARPR